ncbi:MAG: transporter substrate-binding domain-containing protein [Candidatus Riflebacteria bacterium]|nr:transporter substrate-binding domain-containing protein [Candidatus Riflebacteria bacterium]
MQKNYFRLVSFFTFFTLALLLTGCCKKDQKPETKLKLIDIKLTNEEYAFAVSKKNPQLRDNLNQYIETLKTSGIFESIVAIYTDKENKGSKTGVKFTTAEVANTDKNLIIVTNCPFEPFEFIEKDGLMYGIDLEIANAYANYRGLELIVRNIDFDNILSEVAAGKADIGMAGITVTEERKELCDFTTGYFKSSQKLVVDGKNTDFDNCKTAEDVKKVIKSLNNETIGYQIGTTGNLFIVGDGSSENPGFVNIRPQGFKTPDESIKELLHGKIYAAILDDEPAQKILSDINIIEMQKTATKALE